MKRCTICWQGYYVNGVCSNCQHNEMSDSNRYPMVLPLMSSLHNRYVIGSVLGKGGFGITYSAWDNIEHRKVALKELFPAACVNRVDDDMRVTTHPSFTEYFETLKQKFEEEARLLQLLSRSHATAGVLDIIQVFDLFHCNNTVYYAMEYLDGCDLNTYRKKHGRLSWDFLAPIMHRLLQTLSILHPQNIIHRDISPDNIFLLRNHSVRLIDFGVARTYQGKHNLTILKKEGFAPWEQISTNGKQGPWTDIYALSVTMYLLLGGRLPPLSDRSSDGTEIYTPETAMSGNT